MPQDGEFRYTDEHPYISTGGGRNSVKGKAYTGIDADVAEFEDLYLNHPWNGGINKMGLGVDEFCDATINFARKNYADLMPDGSIKKVGNTIKSRTMSGYLKNFIDEGISLLLHAKGKEFLDKYYDYIKRIYNYQIPIKDIASKGNVKTTLQEYKEGCNQLTKAGSKKARQAWYELMIQNDLDLKVGESVYYINTGKKNSDADVKRITHQYAVIDNEEVEIKGKVARLLLEPECEKLGIAYNSLKAKQKKDMLKKHIFREYDEIVLNCKLVPQEIIDSEEDIMCSDVEGMEYNVEKYIKKFNSRISTLLVCFHPDIRDRILVETPENIPYFTEAESQLVSGYPNKESDQDTYEALMTPERKEIEYWLSINETPPFVKECGIDWGQLIQQYRETVEKEKTELFQALDKDYREAIDSLSKEEVKDFFDEGIIPPTLAKLVYLDSSDMKLHFNDLPEMTPSTGGNIIEDITLPENWNYVEDF